MNVNFNSTDAGAVQPIVFEQVFAEKSGGGLVGNPTHDILPGTAVGLDAGVFKPIKSYHLTKAVAAADTIIEVAKGSGVIVGDIIGVGKKAVACTAIDQSNATHDVVTVTLGVDISRGKRLYQAKAAHATQGQPIYTPAFVTGEMVYANQGDKIIRLVNGANLRKETAPIADEVVAQLTTINLV